MATLDSVLNWLVPMLVIMGICAMLYTSKLKEPINQFIRWIAKAFGWVSGAAVDKVNTQTYETVYKYG